MTNYIQFELILQLNLQFSDFSN